MAMASNTLAESWLYSNISFHISGGNDSIKWKLAVSPAHHNLEIKFGSTNKRTLIEQCSRCKEQH